MKHTQLLMDFQFHDINPILVGIADAVPPIGVPTRRLSHALVHYVISGRGHLHIDGETYTVSAGQAFIIPTAKLASYGPDPEDPWSYRWVGFTGTLSHAFEHFPPVVDLPNAILANFCDVLMPGIELKKIAYQLTAELFTLYCYLCSSTNVAIGEEADGSETYIHAVIDHIQNHHTEKLSVTAIANMLHLDRTYLCKIFKKKIGCSIQQFILDVRIMTAMRLIESGKSFKETAYLSGFNDPSNFTRIFTREVGKTPSEWKQFLLDNFEEFRKYKTTDT